MPSNFNRTTEESSLYHDIEKLSTEAIVSNINTEDKKVAFEVEKQIPKISLLVDAAAHQLQNGGRQRLHVQHAPHLCHLHGGLGF